VIYGQLLAASDQGRYRCRPKFLHADRRLDLRDLRFLAVWTQTRH
jgi:hypothetical protein